jgi:hypothetical protein
LAWALEFPAIDTTMGHMSTTASSSPSTAPGSAALLLACPHCAATNRLPAHRIDEAPSCGKCGQPLLQGQPLAPRRRPTRARPSA